MGIHYFALIIITVQSVGQGCSNGYESIQGQDSVVDIDVNEAGSLNGIPMEDIVPQEVWNIVATFAPCSGLCAVSSTGRIAFAQAARFRTMAIDHKFGEVLGLTPDCKSPMDFERLQFHRPVLIDNLQEFKFNRGKLLKKTEDGALRWKGIETNTDTPFVISVWEVSRSSKQSDVTNTWPRRTNIQKLAVVMITFEGEGSSLQPMIRTHWIDCDISHCVLTNPLMVSRRYENGCTMNKRWTIQNLAWYLETGSLTLPDGHVDCKEITSRRARIQQECNKKRATIRFRKRIVAIPTLIFFAMGAVVTQLPAYHWMMLDYLFLACGYVFLVLMCIV